MSTYTYTSSERAQECEGTDYPPCCGRTPFVLTWRRRPFVALECRDPECPNHIGVLGYSDRDARDEWERFRR